MLVAIYRAQLTHTIPLERQNERIIITLMNDKLFVMKMN